MLVQPGLGTMHACCCARLLLFVLAGWHGSPLQAAQGLTCSNVSFGQHEGKHLAGFVQCCRVKGDHPTGQQLLWLLTTCRLPPLMLPCSLHQRLRRHRAAVRRAAAALHAFLHSQSDAAAGSGRGEQPAAGVLC